MTLIVASAEARLARQRAGMRVYRAALRKAMARVPMEHVGNLLSHADTYAMDGIAPEEVQIAWGDIAQFERAHPDVSLWGKFFGLKDEALDALFLLAMAIEARASDKEQAVLLERLLRQVGENG